MVSLDYGRIDEDLIIFREEQLIDVQRQVGIARQVHQPTYLRCVLKKLE